MLAYFPERYPEELLYSVLARYCRHVGSPGVMQTLRALFGNGMVVTAFDLPGHLDALAKRIPTSYGLSVDQMIDELTLYPYITAFEPSSVRHAARRAMQAGAVEGLYVRLGLAAFRTERIPMLRFCAQCQAEMRGRYGEAYWRRDHQLPSVLVCPEHGCPLQESNVSFHQRSRHDFIVADMESCPHHARPAAPAMESDVLAHLHRLAQRSVEILLSPPAPRSFEGWTRYYRSRLAEAGLVRSAKHVDQRKLATEFQRFYGRTLEMLSGAKCEGKHGGWLAKMARMRGKASHPLHHLLLQDFLSNMEKHDSPFGSGPWACLNPLACHNLSQPVAEVKVHRNHGNKVGVFECTCGYAYTRCFDVARQKLGAPRFLRFGPLLEPRLRELISRGAALREAARLLKLDPQTVVRNAYMLGIATPWGVKQLSHWKRRPTEITNPRDATEKNVPHPCKTRARMARRDWAQIDRTLVQRLATLVKDVDAVSPPVRVSLAELERRLGHQGWLAKRRHRLPLTFQFLERSVETVEQFQLRRIYWAIAELQIGGGPIRAWKVMRMAGLRSASLPRIEAVLVDDLPAQPVAA